MVAFNSFIKREVSSDQPFRENKLRGKIFRTHSVRMMPNGRDSAIRAYNKYISNAWVESLQEQLGRSKRYYDAYKSEGQFGGGTGQKVTRSKMGLASGSLQKSIEAKTTTTLEHNPKLGQLFIDFESKSSFLAWGNYISHGRSSGYIPYWRLTDWIEDKIAQGSLNLDSFEKPMKFGLKGVSEDTVHAQRKSREDKIMSFAVAISRKAEKMRKPPVISNWDSYADNQTLRTTFLNKIRDKGGYYRTRIRKSILKNMTKDG